MGALIFAVIVAFGTAFEVSRHRTAALSQGRARYAQLIGHARQYQGPRVARCDVTGVGWLAG